MRLLVLILLTILQLSLFSQSILHFSTFQSSPWLGSARYTATGGALSALGNDAASIMDNPANAATYRAGEISISGMTQNIINDGLQQDASLPQFHFGSAKDIKGGVFSFSFDFRQSKWKPAPWRQEQLSPNSSKVDNWLDTAKNNTPESLLEEGNYQAYGAYQAYILEYDTALGWYPLAQGLPEQNLTSLTREIVKNQTQITGAIRLQNIALGYGFEFFNQRTIDALTINENGFSPAGITKSYSMNLTDSAQINGFRVRLGSVVRLTKSWRWGTYWTSASVAKMNWKYNLLFNSSFYDADNDEAFEQYQNVKFQVINPQSIGTSLAYVFERRGFISAEYKYYAKIKLPIQNPIDWSGVGDEISKELKSINEFKFGSELRKGIWSYRAGYRHSGNGSIFSDHSSYNQYSIGMGMRGSFWNLDLALSHTTRNGSVYHPINSEPWNLISSQTAFITTYSLRLR